MAGGDVAVSVLLKASALSMAWSTFLAMGLVGIYIVCGGT